MNKHHFNWPHLFITTIRSGISVGLFICISFQTPAAASPQAKKIDDTVSGEIVLEDVSSAKKNPYLDNQSAAIAAFKSLDEIAGVLASGGSGAPTALSENAMNHLTAVYLYCSVRSGPCTFILDSILEFDVLNALITEPTRRQMVCPTMERFWKVWSRSDMEKRQKYLLRTGSLNQVANFNANERPSYIKCQVRVQAELPAITESGAKFYAARYGVGTPVRNSLQKTIRLLEEIQQKIPNVLAAAETRR